MISTAATATPVAYPRPDERPRTRIAAVDLALGGVVALAAAAATWWMYGYWRPLDTGGEQWFQADIYRVWVVLTDRYSGLHERSRIHPLFSLIGSTFVYGLRLLTGMHRVAAVHLWLSMCAGLFMALVYGTARQVGFRRDDTLLVCALVLVSASMIFWAPVPETKTLGAASILMCVTAAAIHARRPLPDWVLVAVAAASLSITVTNFMAGLILLGLTRPVRRAAQLAVNAFFAVSVLQIVQNLVYTKTQGMAAFSSERRFLFDASAGTPLNKLIVSVYHSMVVPVMQTPVEFDTRNLMLSVQRSMPGATGALEWMAVLLWTLALAWGGVELWKRARRDVAWATAGLIVVAQIVFHLVYGDQTFLYTLHFLPLMVLAAALVVKSPRPMLGRALLCALLAISAVSNARNVVEARRTLDRIVPLALPIFSPADQLNER